MTKFMLAAGAAAMALAAPALAGPGGHGGGGGGGHGGGGGGGNPHAQGGGGGGHRGGGHGGGFAVAGAGGGGGHGHQGGGFVMRQQGHGHGGGQRLAMRSHGGGHAARIHNERSAQRLAIRSNRQAERVAMASRGNPFVRDHGRTLAFAGAGTAVFAGARYARYNGQRAVIDGCPPGLAAKHNGCMPPGQLKKQWGYGAPIQQSYANTFLPGLYRTWYPDNQQYYYRYGDGYAYRVDRNDNLVSGLFPLMGGDYYAPGEHYPSAYDFYNVPQPYQSYYPDNGPYDYRYGDGAIYQVDRSNGLIQSIVALLTGGGLGGGYGGGYGGSLGTLGGLGGLGIGQPLPTGYDVYNVPYAYRDRYYDTPDANYRYADGNIYQVDPRTQVIQQIISAMV